MTPKHSRKATEMDPRGVDIHFPPEVQRAFADLAAAVHFSEHFDADTLKTVQEWAEGKPASVYDVFTAFPLVAQETFKHIEATGDERAAKAWREIGSELLERGFTLAKERHRGK
jgi:sugar phosphate isomerase/epimerase